MDNAQYVRTLKDLKVKLERLQKKKFKDQTKVLNNELLVLKYKNKIHKIVSKNLFGDENKLTDFESKLGKISNGVVLPSKVYSKSKNVFRVVLTKNEFSKYNKSYTKDDIKKVGLKISKKLSNEGLQGTISTTLNFNGIIRSGFQSNINGEISIFDPKNYYNADNYDLEHYANINSFDNVVFWITATNEYVEQGGNSSFNDCFWFCLNNGISQYNPWKKPEDLKKFLKIGRGDLIGLKHMEQIEREIGKVGINISGDCFYISKLGHLKNLNLVLKNNHYQINHGLNRKVKFCSYTDKTILLYNKTERIGFDGTNEIYVDEEYYDEILNFKTEYMIVERTKFHLSVSDEYEQYIKLINDLKNKSNGLINIYRTGTIKKTALKLLDDTTKHISPEHIEYDEALIIENSTSNGFIFNEEYEGVAHKGDISSLYPSIYSSKNMLVPIKRGIFKILTNENIIEMNQKLNGGYAFGLYRFNIYKSGNSKIDRLFRFKPLDDPKNNNILRKNFYTSVDLKMADTLGLKKELIIDNDINCVLYPRSHCLTGFEIFGKFVEVLKPLKEQNIDGAKLILNILSGSLSEKNIKKLYIDEDSSDYINLDELNLVFHDFMLTLKNKSVYKCISKDQFYMSNFARFKPFMLAYARQVMLNIILPVNDLVKKVYIDSIITTEPLEYKVGWGLLKCEYSHKNIKIVNNRKEIFL